MTHFIDATAPPSAPAVPQAPASPSPTTTHARALPDGLHIIIPHARLPFCLGCNEGDIEILDIPAFSALLAERLNSSPVRPDTQIDDAEAIIENVVDDIRAESTKLPPCLAAIPDNE